MNTISPPIGQENNNARLTSSAMMEAIRWLISKEKVPYYVDGTKRHGVQNSPDDLAAMATYKVAVEACAERGEEWEIGFATGPDGEGGYWQAIDFDKIDDNGLSELAKKQPGYVEYSRSLKGTHAYGYGRTFKTLTSNESGIEAYSTGQFMVVTTNVIRESPLIDLASFVEGALAPLHARYAKAKSGGAVAGAIDASVIADLKSALASIPPDCGYHDWIRIGAACKSVGPEGRDLFLDWSRTVSIANPKVSPEDKWEQLAADRTSYKVIFAEAALHGWQNPAKGWGTASAPVDTSALFAAPNAAPSSVREPAFKRGVSAAALMAKEFNPVRYVVPGYIAEGVTLLAGAPKIGKSWMAMGLCVAVATGEPALGSIRVEQGDVLYLALEDNERRLQKRLSQMGIEIPPHRLTLVTEWPDMNNGCVAEIDLWIDSVTRPLLIVIDVLNKVRAPSSGREPQYEADYRAITGLQRVAAERGIAIVVLHHTRKQEADDQFDLISGTRGLTGAADTAIVLHKEKGAQHSVLYGRGRDIEEIETAVQFEADTGRWVILGSVYSVAKTAERQAILDALTAAGKPMSPSEVAAVVGKERSNVNHLLSRMLDERRVTKVGSGLYTPFTPFTPVTVIESE